MYDMEEASRSTDGWGRKKSPMRATTNGVLQRTTFMVAHSRYGSAPKWSLYPRGPSSLVRASSVPAPGTYDLPDPAKSKYKDGTKFSFANSNRFVPENPRKRPPGPGAYEPRDPNLATHAKVSFGGSNRPREIASPTGVNPGPGAYELRSTVGGGLMFTARGRNVAQYLSRSRSMPGPGAYSPTTGSVFQTAPKCGFGTSSRDAENVRARRAMVNPGPGTYETDKFRAIGRDASKYSATSRHPRLNLDDYLTPGPGAYNAHVTSFGY
jgi:hypothetical protein